MTEWSVNRLAARAVAIHGPDAPAERRELLEMLGLVDEAGRVVPDDTRFYELTDVSDATIAERDDVRLRAPQRDRTAVPPGLANLPPQKIARTLPPASGCGTLRGRSQHFRRGEPLCRACLDAQNAYQREYRARKRAENPRPPKVRVARPQKPRKKKPTKVNPNLPPRPETCGSLAGRANHLRRGEKPCPACYEAINAYNRSRRARGKWTPEDLSPSPEKPVVHVPGQLDLLTGETRSA